MPAQIAGHDANNRKEWRETGAQFLAVFPSLAPPAFIAAVLASKFYRVQAGSRTYCPARKLTVKVWPLKQAVFG